MNESATPVVFRNGYELLEKEQDDGHIVTFCRDLDSMLGGGISLGKITEFSGVPGVGKTQICMQLAVDAHIPESLGGLEGDVVYIDTEGGFIVDRLIDIATATVEHCLQLAAQQSLQDDLKEFTLDKVLSGIHYRRCLDHTQAMAVIHQLPQFLVEHSNVKLVILDSVAAPFKLCHDDPSLRTQVLASLAQTLNRLATKYHLAVVLTNHMTTRVRPSERTSFLTPALGDSWGHASSVRVMLYWQGEDRRALLLKSTNSLSQCCSYRISHAGIRDSLNKTEPVSHSAVQSEKGSDGATPGVIPVLLDNKITTAVTNPINSTGSSIGENLRDHPPPKRQRTT